MSESQDPCRASPQCWFGLRKSGAGRLQGELRRLFEPSRVRRPIPSMCAVSLERTVCVFSTDNDLSRLWKGWGLAISRSPRTRSA